LDNTIEKAKKTKGYNIDRIYPKYLDHNIHVMTINCILQNPGENAFDQGKNKRNYLSDIISNCKVKGKKVVLFFDEIHDSIHNFDSNFVPNLVDWEGIVHKAYISSATYTPASLPVIQYIASLTNNIINIYETPRLKIAQPVSLYLHITEMGYSGENLLPLNNIIKILETNKGKTINILTGNKSITDKLNNLNANSNAPDLINAIKSLRPNIITSDSDKPFIQDRSNMGTKFKTGIDIQDNNSVFIIIMPCIKCKNTQYGIFSDGLPSIIQSMARVRKIGQVHVFMPEPDCIIDLEASKLLLPELDLSKKKNEVHKSQNEYYNSLVQTYDRLKERKSLSIQKLSDGNPNSDYQYPTLTDYIVGDSQNLLVMNNYSYGKGLSPYILWAALNNQFTNASLREVTYTSINRKVIKINKAEIFNILKNLINEDTIIKACKLSLIEAISVLLESLEYEQSHREITAQHIIKYNNVNYNIAQLKSLPFFVKELVNIYVTNCSQGRVTELIKEDYILACSLQSANITFIENNEDKIESYTLLNLYRRQFIDMITPNIVTNYKGQKLIHRDEYKNINESLINSIFQCIQFLKTNDPLITNKVFQFLPKIGSVDDLDKKKKTTYIEFEKCFTNVTSVNKSYNGEKDMYYLINGEIERTLPDEILSLKLL